MSIDDPIRFFIFSALRIFLFFYLGYRLQTNSLPVWKYVVAVVILLSVFAIRQFIPQDFAFSLINQILRALVYTILFAWLYRIQKRYALFLGVVLTELMDIWRGVIYVTLPWMWFTLTGTALGWEDCQQKVLAVALGCLCVIVMSEKFIRVDPTRTIDWRELFVSLFPTIICYLNILTIHFRDSEVLTQGNEFVSIMAILVALNAAALLIILIASEQYFQNQKQKELLMEAEQRINYQYDLFLRRQNDEEDLRLIYHDLKNHLATLRSLSEDMGRAYIDELTNRTEDELSKVDISNATLNVLIEQKKMHCKRRNIDLQAYVNLKDGSFLSQMEVCALFGNAIDNAIEAVESASDGRRTIRLTGGTIANCLVVQCENDLHASVQLENGLPATTKRDVGRHGLGLRSIQKIVESHGGTMSITADGGQFVLKWMIPLPE